MAATGPYAQYAVPWWWALRYSLPLHFAPTKPHLNKAKAFFDKTSYTVGAPRRIYFPRSQREDGVKPLPEIVVMGRPNVGKSSIVKSMVSEETKVIIGKRRGTTKLAHFYLIGSRFFLIDVPGYERDDDCMGNSILREVIQRRPTVKCVLFLVDIRAGVNDVDQKRIRHLEKYHVPYTFVMTRCDDGREWQFRRTVDQLKELSNSSWNFRAYKEILLTSANLGVGVEELRAYCAARAGYFPTIPLQTATEDLLSAMPLRSTDTCIP